MFPDCLYKGWFAFNSETMDVKSTIHLDCTDYNCFVCVRVRVRACMYVYIMQVYMCMIRVFDC